MRDCGEEWTTVSRRARGRTRFRMSAQDMNRIAQVNKSLPPSAIRQSTAQRLWREGASQHEDARELPDTGRPLATASHVLLACQGVTAGTGMRQALATQFAKVGEAIPAADEAATQRVNAARRLLTTPEEGPGSNGGSWTAMQECLASALPDLGRGLSVADRGQCILRIHDELASARAVADDIYTAWKEEHQPPARDTTQASTGKAAEAYSESS